MESANPESRAFRLAPRLASDAEFADVRAMLAECGFTEARICARLAIAAIGDYKPTRRGGGPGRAPLPAAGDASTH